MKRLKLFPVVMLLLLAPSLMTGKNTKATKVDEMAKIMVEKVTSDVALTKDQKDRVYNSANIYLTKLSNINKNSNMESRLVASKDALDQYVNSLDSILDTQQKEAYKLKVQKRKKESNTK